MSGVITSPLAQAELIMHHHAGRNTSGYAIMRQDCVSITTLQDANALVGVHGTSNTYTAFMYCLRVQDCRHAV